MMMGWYGSFCELGIGFVRIEDGLVKIETGKDKLVALAIKFDRALENLLVDLGIVQGAVGQSDARQGETRTRQCAQCRIRRTEMLLNHKRQDAAEVARRSQESVTNSSSIEKATSTMMPAARWNSEFTDRKSGE